MMDKELTALFLLLRAGLWERPVEAVPGIFPLSAEEWKRVYTLARRQTVTGWTYRGLNRFPDEWYPPETLMFRWTVDVDRIERTGRKANAAVESLFAFFTAQGLQPVLLKGQGVAGYYDFPLLREAGDIDLYFPDAAQARRAGQLIRERQIPVSRKADGSLSYYWQTVEVEHHPRLFDLRNPFLRQLLYEAEQKYGFTAQALSPQCTVNVPSGVLNLLLLNTHILKHAVGNGIGLRQLCDMARACHHLHGRPGIEALQGLISRAGLTRWSSLLHAFLVNDLGMDATLLPYPEKPVHTGALRNLVVEGGNFGQHREGCENRAKDGWRRKWHTATSFVRHIGFSGRYAPAEAFWTVADLIKGQVKPC